MAAPKLRFNEFDESWSQVILDDLAEVERGKFSVRPRNDPRYFGGKMPFVQTGDVTGSDVYLKGFSQTLNEDGIKVSKVFPEDTILITIAANIGDTTITQYPVACPDSVVAIQPKKELTNTIFLKNVIDLQKDFLDSQATQNAQKNINLQVLKPLELIVPSLKEQTKIATFLSAVDEKISQLTQKHELLSQYKQGMMQKLFSQQIRFKADDGSEFGEWGLNKISDLFVEIKDKVLGQNIETYSITAGKGFVSQAEKFGRDISGQQNSNYIVLQPQDFSYNKGNSKSYKYGCVYLNEFNHSIAVPNVFISFRTKNQGKVCEKFYAKLFEYHYLDKHLRLLISSSARMDGLLNVSKDGFFEISVPYPCLEEQTKIANFLSAIDQKIEVVAQQIEQAKQWKKGLLQQMFV